KTIGYNGEPILVVVAPPGLAFLATPPWRAAQGLFPTLFGLALVASGMIQVVGFDRPCQLPLHLIGQSRIAQPPTPAIARPHKPPHLSGNTARGTRQAQQKRRENPMHDRALATVQERSREVIEGAPAVLLFTAVAFQSGLVVVVTPRTDVVTLTPRTLERPILPAQGMDVGLTCCGVEEVVQMRNKRHG